MDTSGYFPQLGNDDPLFEIAEYSQIMKAKLESTWTTLTLSGTWVAYVGGGGYFNGLRWRKVGSNIQVQGMVKSGAAGSTIATLPVGARPAYSVMYVTEANAAGTLSVLLIDSTSGNISYRSGPAAPAYVNINVTFPVS